jgi:fructokinase
MGGGVRLTRLSSGMRIGIDLGGTKIEGIALADDGRALQRRRIPAPRGSYDDSVRAIAGLVATLEVETGARGTVGVGIPGAISPATGLVKNANSTWLIGQPLSADLSRALDRPVRLANDANCFALSEATDGAAAGARVVFGVIIGTGTGGGVVVDGRVLAGANAIAGEWGHNPLPAPRDDERPGPACYCGRSGCIETFLSGPGVSRDYAASGGADLSAAEVAARAAAGEPRAAAALARYEDRFARAIATIINVLDPDVVVLGGGLSNIAQLYARVPAIWSSYVFSDRVDTRLVRAMHGDASGVRGAAWLWEEP